MFFKKRYINFFYGFCCYFILFSCETNKTGRPVKIKTERQIEITKALSSGKFNPNNVSAELKEAVKNDVVYYVNELNNIIRRRDFNEWKKRLTQEYQNFLASPENLERASQAERLKKQKIVLKSLYDYFINVVVPSRSRDQVDDIEFVKEDTIKAYTLDANSRKLRLYELQRKGDSWVIVN
ncbi:MAG: hypothetical protein LBC53_07365 [Spirochaetaceae bacterium]|jgi:hypothetical protein|nr:hypothetical protein [Spirochaetaceae bacterium]